MHSQLSSDTPDLIRVLAPSADGARISDFSDPVLVGYDDSCDLRLDDRRIARLHAEIYRVGDLWWVRDLGSADGTYLDEECIDVAPVTGPSTLQLGFDGPTIWLDPAPRTRAEGSAAQKTRAFGSGSRPSPSSSRTALRCA